MNPFFKNYLSKAAFARLAMPLLLTMAYVVPVLLTANASLAGARKLAPARSGSDSVSVDSLLLKISHAEKTISYSGIQERTSMHTGKPTTFRWQVFHWAPDQTLIRFFAPDTLSNTTFYKDSKVVKISGDSHIGRALRRAGGSRSLQEGQLLQQVELLRQNYTIRVLPGAPYLQRPVLELSIEPNFKSRPAFFAKIDAETGILLETRRRPALAKADSAIQISRFVEIGYGAPPEHLKDQKFTTIDSLRRRRSARKYHDMAALMSSYKETLLIPNKLPAGFALQHIRAFQKERRSFVHLHYGDGLSMISLFQRKNGDRNLHKRGNRRQKASSLTMTQGEMAGVHYHIVGEIAAAELEEMAVSLVPITRQTTQQVNYVYLIAIVFVFVSGFYLVKTFKEKSGV